MLLLPLKQVSYGTFGFKIIVDGATVGKIYCDIIDNTFIINYIIISEKYRGQGYAKKSIKLLMKKYKHYKYFETTTIRKTNMASRNLFKSLGFKEIKHNKQIYAIYKNK